MLQLPLLLPSLCEYLLVCPPLLMTPSAGARCSHRCLLFSRRRLAASPWSDFRCLPPLLPTHLLTRCLSCLALPCPNAAADTSSLDEFKQYFLAKKLTKGTHVLLVYRTGRAPTLAR